MLNLQLIDTPKRTALTAHATSLRTKLKDWEKSFAASHSGQKPSKDDIKACLEIAKAYKKYNRVRDVLAGKLAVESLDVDGLGNTAEGSPSANKSRVRRHDEGNRSDADLKRKTVHASVLRTSRGSPIPRRNPQQPNELDPYDHPTSSSPRPYHVTAIGPTPQRDGKALGLFDLLSKSAKSSQGTSSMRKRKFDRLGDVVQQDMGVHSEQLISQTPTRKTTRKADMGHEILYHVDGSSPIGNQRHSRTPVSEGKKLMLSYFFATPSTMRLAIVGEENESHDCQRKGQDAHAEQTPLRAHVLGDLATRAGETELPALDTTPAYLKRSYTFKDRLLSVSTSATGTAASRKMNLSSPNSVQNGPPTLRRYKSAPKPLSEIVRGLRQMDDELHEDDLNALRDMENGKINVLVDTQAAVCGNDVMGGSGAQGVAAGDDNEAPQKVWRKKGQKRTTKRTNMRPVKMMPKEENQWVAEDSGSGDDDEEAAKGLQNAIKPKLAAPRPEDRDLHKGDACTLTSMKVQTPKNTANLDKGSLSEPDTESEEGSDGGELDEHEELAESKAGRKRIRSIHVDEGATKSPRSKGKGRDRNHVDETKQKRGPTINPNAVSHQNFRSLKIRNKSAKGKSGRGMFARKRR